jgi:ribosome-associated protein
MDDGLFIRDDIVIPSNEIYISVSRAGGPGGQHVNKVSTRVTVRWNVKDTVVLSLVQKNRVIKNLKASLTKDGELVVYSSESRSQLQNKKIALDKLAQEVKKALIVPKKRMKTRISKSTKESRLRKKLLRSEVKKARSKKSLED